MAVYIREAHEKASTPRYVYAVATRFRMGLIIKREILSETETEYTVRIPNHLNPKLTVPKDGSEYCFHRYTTSFEQALEYRKEALEAGIQAIRDKIKTDEDKIETIRQIISETPLETEIEVEY